MLVLTRRMGESVIVGDENGVLHLLKVTVVDIGNRKVQLGFEVDSSVPVHRMEVWERIRAEKVAGRQSHRPTTAITECPRCSL